MIGKKVPDGVSGTDKNLLFRDSSQELYQTADDIYNDDKQFAAHNTNNEGKEFSLAEKCV